MKLPNKPKVLAATYNPVSNTKMISFLVDFPTVLLGELRTHRILTQGSLYEHSELVDFNLSANSARAIPSNKYLDKVLDNPFTPIWTKQQKGMSGDVIQDTSKLNKIWIDFLSDVVTKHTELNMEGSHKQNSNRLLSSYAYTTCIISGTEFENFFELRCPKYEFARYNEQGNEVTHYEYAKSKKEHIKQIGITKPEITPDTFSDEYWNRTNKSSAQPEFQVIAEILYDLYQEADWKESKYHIPFEEEINKIYGSELKKYISENLWIQDLKMKISASMCAKLSYNTQDNEDTLEKHLERANMLIEHKHQEPFSHQAVAMDTEEFGHFNKTYFMSSNKYNEKKPYGFIEQISNDKVKVAEYGWCYNLRGFISQRYILENY